MSKTADLCRRMAACLDEVTHGYIVHDQIAALLAEAAALPAPIAAPDFQDKSGKSLVAHYEGAAEIASAVPGFEVQIPPSDLKRLVALAWRAFD